MLKKVVSEIDIITGIVECPKGFEINREKITNDILNSFAIQDTISLNPKDFSYTDYKVPFSQPLQWLKDYLRDHFKIEYNKTLVGKLDFGFRHDLDHKNYAWFYQKLKNPRYFDYGKALAHEDKARMPNFNLSHEEIEVAMGIIMKPKSEKK